MNTPRLSRILLAASLIALCAVVCATQPSKSFADEVKGGMDSLLKPFREIQPYIAEQSRFANPGQREQIAGIISELRRNFHKLEAVPSRYHALPGFDENLRAVADLLDDSSRRFQEGKSSYAWWRLRKLPSDCFTCHATYKVSSHYSNPSVIDQSLDALNKGRFLLATRQFPEARAEFLKALDNPENRPYCNEALRSLLLISTRIDSNPAEGAATLKQALSTPNLPEEDARVARLWIDELGEWAGEKRPPSKSTIAFAEQLITAATVSSPSKEQNDVALLRGTAILHQLLERDSIKLELRPHALYLLGLAYSKLPLFFSESWAEMYLERCINEYPGSGHARKAFAILFEEIAEDYTGTAGTEIPAEVQLHLNELRKKAFGERDFNPYLSKRAKLGS